MKIFVITLFFSFLFVCCQNPNEQLQKELTETKSKLESAEKVIAELNKPKTGFLVHEVYFNLKDDLTVEQQQTFLNDIKKLKDISVVKNLKVGNFENLNDPRALKDYEMVMTMEFKDKKAYAEYQSHAIHLALKKAAGEILEAPPATYDFILE